MRAMGVDYLESPWGECRCLDHYRSLLNLYVQWKKELELFASLAGSLASRQGKSAPCEAVLRLSLCLPDRA